MAKNSLYALLALIWVTALLGQFARLTTPLGMVSWYEIFMALFAGMSLVLLLSQSKSKQLPPFLPLSLTKVLPVAWFLYLVMATLSQSEAIRLIGVTYVARIGLYLVFGWTLLQALRNKWLDRELLTKGTFLWLLSQALFGLGQYLWFPDSRMLQLLGWDDHFGRAFGTLLEPGIFGLLMAVGLVWNTQRLLKVKKWRESSALVLSWLIFLLALTVSFSRSSLIAALVGIGVLLVQQKGKRLIIILCLVLTVIASILAPRAASAEGQNLLRTASIDARGTVLERELANLTPKQVLIGGWYMPLSSQGHAKMLDSGWLQLLLSSGVFGCVLGIAFIIQPKVRSHLSSPILATIVTASLFSPGFFYTWILLFITMGMSLNFFD